MQPSVHPLMRTTIIPKAGCFQMLVPLFIRPSVCPSVRPSEHPCIQQDFLKLGVFKYWSDCPSVCSLLYKKCTVVLSFMFLFSFSVPQRLLQIVSFFFSFVAKHETRSSRQSSRFSHVCELKLLYNQYPTFGSDVTNDGLFLRIIHIFPMFCISST